MKKTIVQLVVLFVLATACVDNPSVLSTRLEHISSGALVNCDPYLVPGDAQGLHTCLVLANPFQPSLRVYDVTDGQFLLAPIGYSPLALRLDGMTSQLASLDRTDAGFAFALDANTSKITAFNARNILGATPSFSIAKAPPQLSPATRVQKFFVVNGDAGAVSVLAVLENANISVSSFDPLLSQYGAIKDVAVGTAGSVIDASYDPVSDVIAVMVQSATGTQVVLRKASDIVSGSAGPSHALVVTSRARIAIGSITTDTISEPHLLLMDQDSAKLSVHRLDPASLDETFANTIVLKDSVTAAYFPMGANKETCCGGKTEWVSLGSDNGMIYYLSADDLLNTEKDKVFLASFDLASESGVSRDRINELVGMPGGDTIVPPEKKKDGRRIVCPRQIYFIYASGYVGNVCEGYAGGVTVMVAR